MSERPISMGVLAADDDLYSLILSFLIPPETSEAKARQAFDCILRVAEDEGFGRCDLGLAQSGIPHPEHFYAFEPRMPSATVKLILDDHEDLWVPLAKRFLPFREAAIQRIIWKISKENAYFTVATALPNVVPSIITLPWAVGEFASDTAFLTMNQVRMAFLIAAASDSDVGYKRQRAQIGSIVAAAFGWRAIAREMVSKVPAGGGLVSKGPCIVCRDVMSWALAWTAFCASDAISPAKRSANSTPTPSNGAARPSTRSWSVSPDSAVRPLAPVRYPDQSVALRYGAPHPLDGPPAAHGRP